MESLVSVHHPPRFRRTRHATWANTIINALDAQSEVLVGTDAAGVVLPHLARQLITLHAHRRDVASQVEALVEAHPLYQVLTSMPGIGVRTAVFIAQTLGRAFETGAHLAYTQDSHQSPADLDPPFEANMFPTQAKTTQKGDVPVRLRLAALGPHLKGLLRLKDHPR